MEVRMPGISGIESMRRLKGMLPGLIVVLVSGLTDATRWQPHWRPVETVI